MTRTWTAPPRSSLAVSVLLRPSAPAPSWSWLPLLAGVALVDALTRTCGLPARLKWPNDVLLPDGGDPHATVWRKVAGLLAEAVDGGSGRAVVLGVGLNVNQTAAELPVPTATSLLLAGSAVTDRDTVLRAYLRALADRYRRWDAAGGDVRVGGVAAAYREVCATLGRDVEVHLAGRTPLAGRAVEVDDDGRLVVEAGGALHRYAAGDVEHLRPRSAGD
jgi:BirA family biotin operon repressor/biotin-[acetyl-CoA-carboxylase] ligase